MLPISNVTSRPNDGPEPSGLDAAAAAVFGQGGPAIAAAPPDPYADDAKLLKLHAKWVKQCNDRRTVFERVWWRLLLYLLGRQWIYYATATGQWVDKRLQKWIPRPVTNKMAEVLNTILSVFQAVELSVSCRPLGASPENIMAADTANKYEPPLREDHDMVRVEHDSDWWLAALGNVFWHTWWDYSGDSTAAFVPWERCIACQEVSSPVAVMKAGNVCPKCGNPVLNEAVDENGAKMGAQVRTGHGKTDVCSPLEISFPPVYSDPNDSPVIRRVRWRTREYCEEHYDQATLDKIQWSPMATERSLQMLRSLASATDLGSTPSSLGGEPTESEGAMESELWMKPTKEYPQGLVLRVLDSTNDGDGIVARVPAEGLPGPLPFKTVDGRYIWPWLHTGYEKFGGRGWSRSTLEHLFEKQNQLNQIDSLIQMIVQRTANPVWIQPKGSSVTKHSGEPGIVILYDALAAGGNAKPERIEGAQVPSSLVRIREMILADIESLAGTYDIMKGQKPAGVEAFSAMQLLVERSQSRYGSVLESRGKTYRSWFQIALDMERTFGPDERAYAILGPNGGYTRVAFKKAQLDGSIRVEVEDGSQMPKTSLGTRAAIQQLAALAVIDPKNPETGYRILQVFGRTDLYPGLDAQVMGARREQQAFEEWAISVKFAAVAPMPMAGPTGALISDPATGQPMMQPQPPMPSVPPPGQMYVWQNPEVHIAEHMKWANGDTMQQLMAQRPEIIPFVTWMIQQHQDLLAQQQMAQQAAADPKANGRDGKGVGAGRAMQNSNQESGNPNDLEPPPASGGRQA